jgi:ABC-type multidrug transport system fused ATPase/permease subunit
MDESQKITVLLYEYNSLRTELISRYTAQFQSIAALAIVLIGLITLGGNRGFSCAIILLIAGAIVVYLLVLLWIDIDIARLSREVRRIEADVNNRAGETLMRWETQRAIGGAVGTPLINWLGW